MPHTGTTPSPVAPSREPETSLQAFQRLFDFSKLPLPLCVSDEELVEFVSREIRRRTSELSVQEAFPSNFEAFVVVLRDKICFAERFIETLRMVEETLEERFPTMPGICELGIDGLVCRVLRNVNKAEVD